MMKRLLLMESGSFSTFGGGAAKDTYELYRHLRDAMPYRIDIFADFSSVERGIAHIRLEELLKAEYYIICMNSIRDAIVVDEYVKLHGHRAKILYIDRMAMVTHYYNSLPKRLFSRIARVAGDPERVDRFTKRVVSGVQSRLLKSLRNFGAKSYAMNLLGDMRGWLDCYVGINAEMTAHARRYFTKATRVEYIPISPHDHFVKQDETKDGAAIAVGRLEESQKRFSFLLRGIRRVVALHPELAGRELVRICGPGPDSYAYGAMTARLGIERNVDFLGFVSEDELVEKYNASTFMVSTSEWEGLSHTFMEAMACGIPLLVNDRNDSILSYKPRKRIVTEGFNGLVYRYGDVDDFAAKFYRLYSDRRLSSVMGGRAYGYVRRAFSRSKMLRRYDAVFRRLER